MSSILPLIVQEHLNASRRTVELDWDPRFYDCSFLRPGNDLQRPSHRLQPFTHVDQPKGSGRLPFSRETDSIVANAQPELRIFSPQFNKRSSGLAMLNDIMERF